MEKKKLNKQEKVIMLLKKQQIRDVKDLDSYKLSVCHPNSAGIDLGSREIYVALNPHIAAEMGLGIVHVFNTFTSGLLQCRDLLINCGIQTVSMESTSVYWTTIYYLLENAGIEVCLVNPRKFRMVPGRKTDILDCQWLQTLHLYGLLTGSFHAPEKIKELRTYMRGRNRLVKDRTRYVQRMQKALTNMNLLLHNVLSDITCQTGIAIISSILAGERDPTKLSAFRDPHCKATEKEIAGSLDGYYWEDQLFDLKTNYNIYCYIDKQITETDLLVISLLEQFSHKTEQNISDSKPVETVVEDMKKKKKTKKTKKDKPKTKNKNDVRRDKDLDNLLFQITGTDLTTITGLQANTVLQIISEVGIDMSKFPSAKHFASYLGFVPHNKITGGNIISSKTDRVKSYAAQAFRKVVPAISRSGTALGAYYRRLCPRIGVGKTVVAVCRKLAMIFYNSITLGANYIEQGEAQYKQKQADRERALFHKLAKKYGTEPLYAQ